MDITKKIKKIENKLISIKEDFTDEEKYLIRHNKEVEKKYISLLSKNPNLWQKISILYDSSTPIEYLKGKELLNYLENIILAFYKNSKSLSVSKIDDITRMYDCSPEEREYFYKKYIDIVLNKTLDLDSECDTYTMSLLLKNDRKDIISNIETLHYSISHSILEKYYEYCSKNSIIPVLRKLNSNYKTPVKYLNLLSIDDTVRLLSNVNNENEEIELKVYNNLLYKIMNSPTPLKISIDLEWVEYKLPVERASAIYNALYKKGDYTYTQYLVEQNIISIDEAKKKIKEYCFNNEELDEKVLKENVGLIRDKDILLHIASSNNIDILFDIRLNKAYKNNKKEILKEILNNKKLKKMTPKFEVIKNNSDLALDLAKRGLFSKIILNTRTSYSESDEALLDILLNRYNLDLELLNFSLSLSNNMTVLKALLDQGKYEEYISLAKSNETNKILLKTYLDKILKYIDQNVVSISIFTNRILSLIVNSDKLLEYYGNNDPLVTKILLDEMHLHRDINVYDNNDELYNKKVYKKLKKNIIKLYDLNEENLELVYKTFGSKVVAYVDNENIKRLINLDKKLLKEILSLFPNEKLSMTELEHAYISLREYTFSKDNPNQAEIFTNLVQALKNNNKEKIDFLIKELDSVFDEKLFNILNKKYLLSERGLNPNNHYKILVLVTSKINTSSNKQKYLNILHMICDYYVAVKRAEYSNVNNMGKKLRLPYTFDREGIDEKITKYIIRFESDKKRVQEIIKVLLNNGLDREIIMDIFALIRGEKDSNEIPKDRFSYIEQIRKIIYDYVVDNGYLTLYEILIEQNEYLNLDRIYTINEIPTLDPLKILTNLKLDNLINMINKEEKVFTSLKELLTKKKVHMLPLNITELIDNDISYTEENIATLISFYSPIFTYEQKKTKEKKKKQLVNITKKLNEQIVNGNNNKIEKLRKRKEGLEEELLGEVRVDLSVARALLSAEAYSAISSVFALVLTPEDARLIKDNPEMNSAISKTRNNRRLIESVHNTITLFKRKEVTIPTSNNLIDIDNNKKIRVIVGNMTDPNNLSHGERTGSCMRVGGIGENLYNNAINNKNCIHIKFEDPNTGTYISRVTGFRNGNTLYLNELRKTSSINLYTDKDLAIALKRVSKSIINDSKNSFYPIENVVISNNCALKNVNKLTNLRIEDYNDSINEIYNDIHLSKCIVLATSSTSEFAPLTFERDNLPTYLPARRTIRKITNKKDLIVQINRVDSIKKILAGEDYRLLTSKYIEEDTIYAICNDEWYIYIDENNNIHSNCIESDERAIQEYQDALSKIEKNNYKMKN